MDTSTILEPLSEYKSYYKDKIVENAEKTFDALATESQVSEPINAEIIKRLRKAEAHLAQLQKKSKSIKGWRIFLFFVLAGFAIGAGVCIYLLVTDATGVSRVGLIAGAILTLLGFVGGIFADIFVVKKRIKHFEGLINSAQSKVNSIYNEAYEQMAPLFANFDWYLPIQVIQETCPVIKIDRYFDTKKLNFLKQAYEYQAIGYEDKNRSIMNVVSGTISGNPFLIVKELEHQMINKTYTGSITYTYTDTEYVNGETRTVTRTDTLFASVTQPFPSYSEYNYVVYGNPAGERLYFTRHPSGVDKDEKDKKIDKIVRKGSKKLDKLEEKHLKDNDPNTNFTKMSNEKFDVLFGALDRNDEVAFRALFSPAVQVSMTNLILHGIYGDDFSFFKRFQINVIVSQHSQGFDYGCKYSTWIDVEYAVCKQKFVTYTSNFFSYLFFDLAPLLTITQYQNCKPHMFKYTGSFMRNYTNYEDEAMANELGYQNFAGPGFDTRCILKSKFLERKGNTDYSLITSYSYTRIPQVDYIPKIGRDGMTHMVPVYYDIYEPVQHDYEIGVARFDGKDKDYNEFKFNDSFNSFCSNIGADTMCKKRGLVAFICGAAAVASDVDFNSLIKK